MTPQQIPKTPVAGAAFAFPIGDGRFSVCRVLLDTSSEPSKQRNILVACSKWIGNAIPRADDPALRPILHRNHHSCKDRPNVLWISAAVELPKDFIYIGTIEPTAKEQALADMSYGSDCWSALTCQPLLQWRWDNERDALLAEEMKLQEYREARIIWDSVDVIDDHGLTHKGVRLAWEQVREVGAAGPDSGVTDTPIVAITSDNGEFSIYQGCTEFPAILNGLDSLPGFPSLKFRRVLKESMFSGEVVVWRRGFPSKLKPLPKREMSPVANDAYLSPEEIVVRVRSAFSNVRVESLDIAKAIWVAKNSLGPLRPGFLAKEREQLRDAVTIYVDDEGGRPLLHFTAIRGRPLQVDVGDQGLNWSGYTEADQESAEVSFQQLAEVLGYDRSPRTDMAEPDAATDGGGM